MMGFLTYLVGLVADLISFNRQLLEMTLERVRRMELSDSAIDGGYNSAKDPTKTSSNTKRHDDSEPSRATDSRYADS